MITQHGVRNWWISMVMLRGFEASPGYGVNRYCFTCSTTR